MLSPVEYEAPAKRRALPPAQLGYTYNANDNVTSFSLRPPARRPMSTIRPIVCFIRRFEDQDPISCRPSPLLAFALNSGPFPPRALHRLQRPYGPVRHPQRPGQPSRVSGWAPPPTSGDFPCRIALSIHACRRHYPGGASGCLCHSSVLTFQPSPASRPGRPPHHRFRGLLNVHCSLRPPGSPSHPRWPSTSKALIASLPPRPLRLLPAGEAVAGWVYLPLRERSFSRRTRSSANLCRPRACDALRRPASARRRSIAAAPAAPLKPA
jgi:hypothetical protein